MSLNFYKDAAIGSKNLASKAARKGVDALTDLTLGNIGRISKWTLKSMFNLLVKMPAKAAGKTAIRLPFIPGPR